METTKELLEAIARARSGVAWRLVREYGSPRSHGGADSAQHSEHPPRCLLADIGNGEFAVCKVLARGEQPHEVVHAHGLRHPRIPDVLEVGQLADGRLFVVRQHVEGDVIERLPGAPSALLPMVRQILEILAFVHQRGVVHLDLKPANLVIAADGGVHLLDFGLAVQRGEHAAGGTLFFASPEVLYGASADARADLFSLGAMVVQTLLPQDAEARARHIADCVARFPSEEFLSACGVAPDSLPPELRAFVAGCIARDPQRRFPDADAALEHLFGHGSGRASLASLRPDPVALYESAWAGSLPDRGSVVLRGADADDRRACALHLAGRLDEVRGMVFSSDRVLLRRADEDGGQPAVEFALPALTPASLQEHLAQTLGLTGAAAERAAQHLLDVGTTSAAVGAALEQLACRGELRPSGARWVWPAVQRGQRPTAKRVADAAGASLQVQARDAARAGHLERARALWRSAPAAQEELVRRSMVEGLLDAGEPARALPLAAGLPLLMAQALAETGQFESAGRELAQLGEPRSARHRQVAAQLRVAAGELTEAAALLNHAHATTAERLQLAAIQEQLGKHDEASQLVQLCIDTPEAAQQPYLAACAFTILGHVARNRQEHDSARGYFERASDLAERLGHVRHMASCQLNLGVVAKDGDRNEEAVRRFREARTLYQHVGDAARAAIASANLGIAAFARGDAETARDVLHDVVPRLFALGDHPAARLAAALLARACIAAGDAQAAEAALLRVGQPDTERLRHECELARTELRALADCGQDDAVPADDGTPRDEARKDTGSNGPSRELFRTFVAVNRRLAQAERLDDAMATLLDAAVALTGGRNGYLLVVREDGVRREFQSGGTGGSAFSRTLAHRAIDEQRTLTGNDMLVDEELRAMRSVRNLEVRSAVCTPFRGLRGVRGALYVEHPGRAGVFAEIDKEALEVLADQAAIAVERMLRDEELRHELDARTRELDVVRRGVARAKPVRLLGDSEAIQALRAEIDRLAAVDLAVLVLGETGTGKELVARALHERGARAAGPFVAENCAALPSELMERELFGHVQGAFTGADRDRPGLLELANGGTLFLDEVGDMPTALQVKLLRALQERAVRRVGGAEPIQLDLRLVAATHRDLRAMVAAESFREDLYYRIAAVELRVPPLRERGADVVLLADHFLRQAAAERGRGLRLADSAAQQLCEYTWPGNVRELEHIVARAALLCDDDVLEEVPLPSVAAPDGGEASVVRIRQDAVLTLREAERRTIVAALAHHGGDKTRAARTLGISRTALYDKIRRLEIQS